MVETGDLEETLSLGTDTAARGAAQWLRMLAQAGLMAVPRLSETLVAGSGGSAEGGEAPLEAEVGSRAELQAVWAGILTPPAAAAVGLAVGADTHPSSSPAAGPRRAAAANVTTNDAAEAAGSSEAFNAGESASGGAPAVKRPMSGGPSYVQAGNPTRPTGAPALRGVAGSPVEDGPPLTLVPDLGDGERVVALQQLAQVVSQCALCPELVRNRTQTVFGYGAPRTRLVLMGEAPGAEEDRLGEPMVGASGQLLDKIIAAMKLRREDVYILNTVKCQPPKNRNPLDVECGNCRPFWVRQLEIIRPEVIVCLGAVASKTLLQTTQPVGRLRGSIHDYRGAKVVVTYHPSYLLRTEAKKRETWEDMKVVMNLLGIVR